MPILPSDTVMTKPPEEIERLLGRTLDDMFALPETGMRTSLLCDRIHGMTPVEIAHFFDLLLKETKKKEAFNKEKALMALALIIDPEEIKKRLGHLLYREVRISATELGLNKVSRLFTDLKPQKSGPIGYDKEEEAKMEQTSLGERRTLSKNNRIESIDRLLSDPDPMVIRNILSNPRTTEREVIKIVSKRPNSEEILKTVASHPKWSKRYAVKKVLALNPYSPPRLAIALLEFLMSQDLKVAATEESLHAEVRASATDILKEREVR